MKWQLPPRLEPNFCSVRTKEHKTLEGLQSKTSQHIMCKSKNVSNKQMKRKRCLIRNAHKNILGTFHKTDKSNREK